MMKPNQNEADRLGAHLIAEHGFTAAYFDEDYPNGGPIRDLGTLRWLHAAWIKTREYPEGCDGKAIEAGKVRD